MSKILSSVACNLDTNILSACYPLLEAGKVEAIEWSFDALYERADMPEWFSDLLHAYSHQQRLIGHGVFFSLFSGRWLKEQDAWLQHLRDISKQFQFDHITEHFGFLTGKDFHHGAPLNIPYNASTLAIGQDRLARIQDACQKPVGLENLAFSYAVDDVKRHGEFLERLVRPVNGFIILDLHNLYCQVHNFDMSFEDIMKLYPLHLVREIHISGGSWEPAETLQSKKVRRDTHDDSVPAEVFGYLKAAMPLCANLKYVVMEQLGNGLESESSRQAFADDFRKMETIVRVHNSRHTFLTQNDFLPVYLPVLDQVAEDAQLYNQQLELSEILETAPDYQTAVNRLKTSSMANSEWRIETWAPYMLETAISIAQKWKKGT